MINLVNMDLEKRVKKLEIQAEALFRIHANHLINLDKEIGWLKNKINVLKNKNIELKKDVDFIKNEYYLR